MNKINEKLSILSLFESVLDEFGVPMTSTTFNMEEFKAMTSFSKRTQYCNAHLKRLSSGSSRIVYMLNDYMVLKLAKNAKGIAQNGGESDGYIQQSYGHIVTKVHEWDRDDLWIVSDFAKKINPARFKQLVGIDLEKVDWYLNLAYAEHNGKKANQYMRNTLTPEDLEFMNNNEFCVDLEEMMRSMDLMPGDLGRISSYGEVLRNNKPAAVLIDYGLTNSTYEEFYKRR